MSQQSIVGRVMQLARANVNAMIDSAEDPQRLLDQLIRDYSAHVSAAEQAIAHTIANLRMIEADQKEKAKAARQWGKQAQTASGMADGLRATGTVQDADAFDNLARVALERQLLAESDVAIVQHTIDAQHESVDKLKAGLGQMKSKLRDLRRRRGNLVARSRSGRARAQPHSAVRRPDIMDPVSDVSRFEETMRREEARVRDPEELAVSSLDAQFARLEDDANKAAVENRLQALKAGRAVARAGSSRSKAPALTGGRAVRHPLR